MDLSQIVALVIFLTMFAAIIAGKVHRYVPALIGAFLMIVVVFLAVLKSPGAMWQVLSLSDLVHARFWLPGHEHFQSHGINWQTVIFIAGMMTMVEGMGETGFFTWICLQVARLVRYRVVPILIAFMLLSGFLSMFIDSITVLLFFAAITIELSRILKFDPVPIIIGMVFAANTGGSATMAGDPPNIIIGTGLGFSFIDFVVNTGPIAWLGILLSVGFFYLSFRKSLRAGTAGVAATEYPRPGDAIRNATLFKISIATFVLIIALLITHSQSGLSVGLIGVIAAALSLLAARKRALFILKRVDWRTLLFFVGLFIVVGGLEITGVLKALADAIGRISNGSLTLALTIVLWISAFASAIVDNIPFAATMVPVIANLSASAGFSLPPLAWALALGTDIGGNATPIGASANVVATAIAEREGHRISWARYLRYAVPATILVVVACWVWLALLYR
jgi:Na+/H+ antiporter NhaD/arsenite permease-like protein